MGHFGYFRVQIRVNTSALGTCPSWGSGDSSKREALEALFRPFERGKSHIEGPKPWVGTPPDPNPSPLFRPQYHHPIWGTPHCKGINPEYGGIWAVMVIRISSDTACARAYAAARARTRALARARDRYIGGRESDPDRGSCFGSCSKPQLTTPF